MKSLRCRLIISFIVVLIIAFIVCFCVIYGTYLTFNQKEEVKNIAREYEVPEDLVFAVIRSESSFDSSARSNKGAFGLMQIMPSTAAFISTEKNIKYDDLFDPLQNVMLGCAYLKYLIDKFDSEKLAVIAYNAGEGNLVKWLNDAKYSADGKDLDVIPFKETEKYFNRVSFYRRAYSMIL